MYVVTLDRPWLETPFVFQGFEIKGRDEIEQLQSYCSYVFVDVARSNLTEAELRSLGEDRPKNSFPSSPHFGREDRKRGWLRRFRERMSRMGRAEPPAESTVTESHAYEISSTVRHEAPQASAAYEHIVSRCRSIVDQVRNGATIDIDTVTDAVTPTIDSILRNPDAMAWTIFSKKKSGRNYSRAVATAVWSIMFGRHLGFDRESLQDLAMGGLLLDIGMAKLPAEIVNAEGAISDEQYALIRQHVQLGSGIVRASAGFSQNVCDMIRCHHERADGSGYPDQLLGNAIPIYGRIAGIVDSYDAMTSKTRYSPALAAYDSARELNEMRGKQFQAEVVGQFLKTIGMFPTGSVVELSDGTVGVVLEQNRVHPLQPKLMLLLDRARKPYSEPQVLDMHQPEEGNSGDEPVWIVKGHEHGAFGVDPFNFFA